MQIFWNALFEAEQTSLTETETIASKHPRRKLKALEVLKT